MWKTNQNQSLAARQLFMPVSPTLDRQRQMIRNSRVASATEWVWGSLGYIKCWLNTCTHPHTNETTLKSPIRPPQQNRREDRTEIGWWSFWKSLTSSSATNQGNTPKRHTLAILAPSVQIKLTTHNNKTSPYLALNPSAMCHLFTLPQLPHLRNGSKQSIKFTRICVVCMVRGRQGGHSAGCYYYSHLYTAWRI